MKGSVTRRKSIEANWVRRDEPSASTVMPVRSETKKTRLRWDMGDPGESAGIDAPQHCHGAFAIIASLH